MAQSEIIPIRLENGGMIEMVIYEESPGTLSMEDPQIAFENGESPYRLKEGSSYEYVLPEGYRFMDSQVVKSSKVDASRGRIRTNIFVGTLNIELYQGAENHRPVGHVLLEVCSVKAGYRSDYRAMLQEITNKCTDLLLRHSSPVRQTFKADADKDSQTLYQRFAFVESLIRSESFADALYRIGSMPVKRWEAVERTSTICNIRRADRAVMRQIMTRTNRTSLTSDHLLAGKFGSLPNHVNITDKRETTDVAENRFIKYVLETFLQFTLAVSRHPDAIGKRLEREALSTADVLERYLSMPVFRDVSRLDMIPLNSPVLQRKEGYREVLQAYLMFDMAAKLIWKGGDDVYHGGKRDVAILYEYWLFFQMLDLIEEVFGVSPHPIEDLIETRTDDTLELTLKRGVLKMIDGVFETHHRKFRLMFSYNRTFSRAGDYPSAGSWTGDLRPDYTLSIWPESLTQSEAEEHEMMVHLHFDAKYRIENFKTLLAPRNLSEEKEEEAGGRFKRADLLKMHAYKDAIRRTAGAYILYPGKNEDSFTSFHELLPGLGAFSVSPRGGKAGLKQFLLDVLRHLSNRTSQHALFSYRTYNTFNEKPGPEYSGKLPLDEHREFPRTTYVLVGYYRSEEHLEWILRNKIYNARTDSRPGSLRLSPETISAKYLLLHTKGYSVTHRIYRLDEAGPRMISGEFLQKRQYPSGSVQPFYIGFTLQSAESIHNDFGSMEWDVRKLSKYQSGRMAAYPFTVTLEELLRGKNG